MGTIFQQILDSERIFKVRNSEINEKRDYITEIEKKIVKLKEDHLRITDSVITIRVGIENNKAKLEYLLKRSELMSNQLNELRYVISLLTQEYNTTNISYKGIRYELTSYLNSQNSIIQEWKANLKTMDDKKYYGHCEDKLKLNGIVEENEKLTKSFSEIRQKYDDLQGELNSTKEQVKCRKKHLENINHEFGRQCYSVAQQNHIMRLKNTVSCFDKDISSMASEIMKKKQFIQSFKQAQITNKVNLHPNQSAHFNNYSHEQPHFSNPYNPYQHRSSNAVSCPPTSERVVVHAPVRHSFSPILPTRPSCTPSDDDLFGDDDDDMFMCSQVIKACEEAEKISTNNKL